MLSKAPGAAISLSQCRQTIGSCAEELVQLSSLLCLLLCRFNVCVGPYGKGKQACIIQLLNAELCLESLLYSSYTVMKKSCCIADNAACVSLTANLDFSVHVN